jgi:hypothetical protein
MPTVRSTCPRTFSRVRRIRKRSQAQLTATMPTPAATRASQKLPVARNTVSPR